MLVQASIANRPSQQRLFLTCNYKMDLWVLRIIVDLSARVFVAKLSVDRGQSCWAYGLCILSMHVCVHCTCYCCLCMLHVCCVVVLFEEDEDKDFEQGRKRDYCENAECNLLPI